MSLELREYVDVEMIEIGHEPATIRGSMLEKLFEIGDRFSEAAEEIEPPGVVGSFTLQLIVIKDLEVVVFDVALRIGGWNDIYMGIGSQYSKLYFDRLVSMGWRIAREIRECVERRCLSDIVT